MAYPITAPPSFSATPATPALLRALSASAPMHPFLAPAYLDAHQRLGSEPWVFTAEGDDSAPRMFPALLRRGRLTRSLWFPSIPTFPRTAAVWPEIDRFLRKMRVADVSFDMYAPGGYAGSPVEWAAMPVTAPDAQVHATSLCAPQRGEVERVARIEYGIDLTRDDMEIWASIVRGHRERIMKARKFGITIHRSRDDDALDLHLSLHTNSMERRHTRGENVHIALDRDEPAAMLATGAGELYRAMYEGAVLSSILIIRSDTGAYSVSSGSSPLGMQLNASHFLQYETGMQLRQEGVAAFFTGGVREHEEGLRSYKESFGPVAFHVEKVVANRAGPLTRAVLRIVR